MTEPVDLREVVAAQAELIDELQRRISTLEHRAATADDVPPAVPAAPTTGRRQLLAGAGMAAAGVVAGTVGLAVGGATPAAAASGSFDGDPAIDATASPGTGVAVKATTATGTAVSASASASSGTALGVMGTSASSGGAGVAGVNASTTGENAGVYGEAASTSGAGVGGRATAPSGDATGVYGRSDSTAGAGVWGEAVAATGTTVGVRGQAASATGVGVAADGRTGLVASADGTHLALAARGASWPDDPIALGVEREAGEVVFDGTRLWVCVASGTPGEWLEVAGTDTAGSLHVLDGAVRAYDSRPGFAPLGVVKGPLTQNQERTIDLTVGGGLPAGARAALVNLTVTGTSSGGFLKLFRPGTPVPTASAVNWSAPGTTIANSATVVPEGGELTIRCGGAGASTDVVVDVVGFYA